MDVSTTYSPPFARLTDTDHGPIILVATYIFFGVNFLSVTTKVWVRLRAARTVLPTDWLMIAALIFTLLQAAAITASVNAGLGSFKSLVSAEDIERASKGFYASNLLNFIALMLSKLSLLYLILAIQPFRVVRISSLATIAVLVAWTIAGSILYGTQCSPHPWTLDSQSCIDQWALHVFSAVFSIVTDVIIVALGFGMIWPLAISMKRKMTVVSMFVFRLVTCMLTIWTLTEYRSFYNSEDRMWDSVALAVLLQATLCASIVTACVPSMKRFFAVAAGISGVTVTEMMTSSAYSGRNATLYSDNTRRKSSFRPNFGKSNDFHSHEDGIELRPVKDKNYRQVRVEGGKDRKTSQESVQRLTRNVIYQETEFDINIEKSDKL